MKNMKKLLSLLLVLTMVFSLAVPVLAEEESADPVTATLVTDYDALATGDQVVIVNKQYKLAMDKCGSKGYYNAGVAVTPTEDGKLADFAESLIWTLTKNDDGTWYIAQGDNKLSMDTGYTSMPANKVNDKWKIAANDDGTCYISNVGRAANYTAYYIEWYASAGSFSAYDTTIKESNKGAFALNLYKIDSADPTPAGDLAGKTVILHTNDIHGMTSKLKDGSFNTTGSIEGYAYVAAVKAAYEARGAKVVLVDAGDYSQGSPYVSVSKGESAIQMMNATGYVAATLGNHEFDYGYEQLAANIDKADFDVLCCNIVDAEGNSIFTPSKVVEVNGVKIGFIGVNTPETQTKANPTLIKGLNWLAGDEMIAAVQAQADALKDEADVVVVLSHLGVDSESEPNRSYDLWNGLTEGSVDFIIDAHSHSTMTKGINDEPIQSTGTASQNVGVIVIDNATKAIESNELVPIYTNADPAVVADDAVLAAAKAIMDPIYAAYSTTFATSEVNLNGVKGSYDAETGEITSGNRNDETNLGDLITDAMLWYALKSGGIDPSISENNVVAITNGGGIRAAIGVGEVKKFDINTVLPFGNTVAVVYVTGAELLEALEASTYCSPTPVGGFPQVAGMEFTINTAKEFDKGAQYEGSTYYQPASIQRVTIDSINGEDFDPDAKYAVITNNFCAGGGDTYYAFSAATGQFDTGFPLDEALMEYITEELNGVITEEAYGEPQGRIFYTYELDLPEFTDVAEEQWFYLPVTALAAEGVINGYANADGTYSFRPDDTLTREQFITMLYRLVEGAVEVNTDALSAFTDAGTIGYGKEAVAWGVESGLINGYKEADGTYTFRPNQSINRAEMAKMMCCFLEHLAEENAPDEYKADYGFADVKDGQWFADYVNVLANLGLVSGVDKVPNYAPDATATRAEAAQIIFNMLLALAGDVDSASFAALAA